MSDATAREAVRAKYLPSGQRYSGVNRAWVYEDEVEELLDALVAAERERDAAQIAVQGGHAIIERMKQELDAAAADFQLAIFGAKVLMQFHGDGERGDVDGGWLQETAVDCSVLLSRERTTPCGDRCPCAEFHGSGVRATCYPIARYNRVKELADI